jgi:hypothetical protein
MTLQSPRIYTYKITFEEVPYYYYGVHKEKTFNEYYMGTPYTHKWCWELYTPKKQILETFSNREDAGEVERRLIKPVYNTDKWCLNENCAGVFSLDTCSKAGKKGSKIAKEMSVGIFSMTKEEQILAGKKSYESRIKNGTDGLSKLTTEERQKIGSKMGKITYELGLGIHSQTKEEKSKAGKKGYANGLAKLSAEQIAENSKKSYENGLSKVSLEQKSKWGKKGYESGLAKLSLEEKKEISKKGAKILNSQRWECCETGYISTSAGVVSYQKGRGIDTSRNNRIKLS